MSVENTFASNVHHTKPGCKLSHDSKVLKRVWRVLEAVSISRCTFNNVDWDCQIIILLDICGRELSFKRYWVLPFVTMDVS